MSLNEEERKILVFHKIQKAKATLYEAIGIAGLAYWNSAANRLYYACFYITSALLIKNGYIAQSHSGVIRILGHKFVTSNIVSKTSAKFYAKLFELRQTGDYDDLFTLTKEDVYPLIDLAKNYIDEIEKLITTT